VVTATLPADTTFASATGGGSFNGTNLVTWSVGSLPAGASGSASFTVNVAAPLLDGTILKSVASIAADDGLPKSQAAPFMVSSTPVWLASKSVTGQPANGLVTFTISLQNIGNEVATGTLITDTLPPELQVVSADNGASVDQTANSVTLNLGDVSPGAPAETLTIVARVRTANTNTTNVALIRSNELPPVSVSAAVDTGAAREPQPIPAIPWPWLALLILALAGLAGNSVNRARVSRL
jgi:uncharacterized repeat protein (TIGR01451 family)